MQIHQGVIESDGKHIDDPKPDCWTRGLARNMLFSGTRNYRREEMEMEKSLGFSQREPVAERLERHPALKARMERILDVVENTSRDLRRADDAERQAIEELRQMGLEVMQGWGQKTANEAARELEAKGGVVREVKKTPLDLHVRRSDGGRTDLPDQ